MEAKIGLLSWCDLLVDRGGVDGFDPPPEDDTIVGPEVAGTCCLEDETIVGAWLCSRGTAFAKGGGRSNCEGTVGNASPNWMAPYGI